MADEQPPSHDAGTNSGSTTTTGGMALEKCVAGIHKGLKHPTVRFLREQMEKAGCPFWPKLFEAIIYCKENNLYGRYARGQGMVICCNRLNNQDEKNQVLIHGLIHAYDDCSVKNLDWKKCAHCACSAIRANHLSGDCDFKRELLRGQIMKIRGHEPECVKRRTLKSLQMIPYCSGEAANEAIEAVWDICYNDTMPFDRAP